MVDDETTLQRGRRCLQRLRSELLEERVPAGHWTGELSASALSTATAVSALSTSAMQSQPFDAELAGLIRRGCGYLDTQQNDDGGYGDTDRSYSNIATSYLVLAARTLAARVVGRDVARSGGEEFKRLEAYIDAAGALAGLRKRYGTDKTFVVPIMTNLAIAGLVDWNQVARLPFEAAVFPNRFYRFLRMPVVSYAIPALVAIGQVHHFLGPKIFWPWRAVRAAAVKRTTDVLLAIQPQSGGYLEATPLTSFVLMSLAASAHARGNVHSREQPDRLVAQQCVAFLRASIREDGSWPIDTNLATWITSLSVHALGRWSSDDRSWITQDLMTWHRDCQVRIRHPFTGAAPGGWGWSDLSGSVPDGDDTPAAILAMHHYLQMADSDAERVRLRQAIRDGLKWLAELQNADGGLPTFCRGWGRLPFDRSSTDLTAHFIRAIDRSRQVGAEQDTVGQVGAGQGGAGHGIDEDDAELARTLTRSRARAVDFLRRNQRTDGSWLPLWFGNQDNHDDENPLYGTSRVLLAIANSSELTGEAGRAVDWLLSRQNDDGGWGGGASVARYFGGTDPSSVEETALVLEAIADYLRNSGSLPLVQQAGRAARCREAIIVAVQWLADAVDADRHRCAWPIGFYFAKLWYYEKLYPLVFATGALSAAIDVLNSPPLKVETSN